MFSFVCAQNTHNTGPHQNVLARPPPAAVEPQRTVLYPLCAPLAESSAGDVERLRAVIREVMDVVLDVALCGAGVVVGLLIRCRLIFFLLKLVRLRHLVSFLAPQLNDAAILSLGESYVVNLQRTRLVVQLHLRGP